MTKRMTKEPKACANTKNHTSHPMSYPQFHDWALRKSKTHTQKVCVTCGFYAIWVPKDKPHPEQTWEEMLPDAVISLVFSATDGFTKLDKNSFEHFDAPLLEWEYLVKFIRQVESKAREEGKQSRDEELAMKIQDAHQAGREELKKEAEKILDEVDIYSFTDDAISYLKDKLKTL